jgi:hypothetical protein
LLGTKPDSYFDLDSFWRRLQQSFFSPGSHRSHAKTRRVFSLQQVDAPSGGFRIRRKTPNKNIIWQLHAINDLASRGFTIRNSIINWKQPAPISSLHSSTDISPLGARHSSHSQVVAFDHWLPINHKPVNGIISVQIAPGTKNRRYIRICQSFDSFISCLENSGISDLPATAIDLPGSIKIPNSKKFVQLLALPEIGNPRSTVFLESIGTVITYWYITENNNAAINQLYQQAYEEHMN